MRAGPGGGGKFGLAACPARAGRPDPDARVAVRNLLGTGPVAVGSVVNVAAVDPVAAGGPGGPGKSAFTPVAPVDPA